MKEVQGALATAAADDSKLVLFSAVGSVFCCGIDFIYFIRRLTDDRKRESTKMADAIRYVYFFTPVHLYKKDLLTNSTFTPTNQCNFYISVMGNLILQYPCHGLTNHVTRMWRQGGWSF